MLNVSHPYQPGEYPFIFPGPIGDLEAVLTIPSTPHFHAIAMLGHPDSRQGGTMNNKVVTTLVRAFKECGIASLRFNFRGVGLSAGEYDAGVGESLDMLQLSRACQATYPGIELIFAGFSFGSYVAYRAASLCPHALLISIAPAVHHYDYKELLHSSSPWIVIQGDADEVVSVDEVRAWSAHFKSPPTYLEFPGTGHFFHGKLIELKIALMDLIQQQDGLCR